MYATLSQWFGAWVQLGIEASDSQELQARKALLNGLSVFGAVVTSLLGIIYFAHGLYLPASLILAQTVGLVIGLGLYSRHQITYQTLRAGQRFVLMVNPFLVTVSLGGIVQSSAVILWGLLSPLGAALFGESRQAFRVWAFTYFVFLFLAAMLNAYIPVEFVLPPRRVALMLVINLGGVSASILAMVYYFMHQRNRILELLRLEQVKTDNLLLNILPSSIAAILKNEDRLIAEHFDEASILFADVVGFTPLSAQLSPEALVRVLNDIFSQFDELVDRHDLEKIKTIGDCYMVAAGVPRSRADHAQAITHLALEMRACVARQTFGGHSLNVRIGINSGPVVAGVIGRKKFIYDLWGDAVNTASRMESHGASGAIQITRATYELIRDAFVCEARGAINVKGKGEMDVWLVIAAKEKSGAY